MKAEESESAGDLHSAQKSTLGLGFGASHLRIQRSGSERHLHHLLKLQHLAKYLFGFSQGGGNGCGGLGVQMMGVGRDTPPPFQPLLTNWGKKICKYTTDYSLLLLRGESMDSFRLSLGGIRTQHTGTASSTLAICNRYRIWLFPQMLTPYPISSKSSIYTNLGGSARAGIYIQVALGTKQNLRKCFFFKGFLNSLVEV